MQTHLTRLFKGTFIYSGGQIFSKTITFFLLPLTTSYLTLEDYGVIASLTIFPLLLIGLFTLGFGVSLSRSYWSIEDTQERHGIIWTGFTVLLINAACLIGLVFFFSCRLSWIVLGTRDYGDLIIWTAISIGFSSALLPFSTYLRLLEKAVLVVSLSLLEVLLTVSFTLYFIVVQEMGCRGVILAGLISQGVNFFLMFVICLKMLRFSFAWRHLPSMLQVGYPYIFGLMGYSLLQTSSRYILQIFTNMDTVGLFFMGFNFARPVQLVVMGFISAWPPFFNAYLKKQDEAVIIFGKVLSYYVLGMSALLVLFFTLARPVVFLMVQPSFHSVWTVVGILATALSLWGVYGISAAALIFNRRSGWQMLIEIAAGGFCVVSNFLLIPLMGKEGAAIATFLSFLGLVSMSFVINHRLLPVRYEVNRLRKIVVALVLAAAITFLPISDHRIYGSLMACTVIAFYSYLWLYCLTLDEKNTILRWIPLRNLSVSKGS